MFRAFYLILLLLLAGCSYKEPKVEALSKQEKDEMHMLLNGQSTELKSLLEKEISSMKTNAKKQGEKKSVQEAFFDLFLQTDKEELLADSEFEGITDVVSQNGSEVSDLFASNLSKYLSDSEYICKEPIYYRYFTERYESRDEELSCKKEVPFSVLSNHGRNSLVWIDPKRVSSVHMLFAGNGDGMMSRFGHMSMRLIVCPEDDYSKEACNTNLYEHIVIGYRAHINELKIDTVKGLMGDYRAYLFANSFMDIYKEYAIGEFRDLYSLPLKLSRQEREDMVRAMSEIHWSYSGDYKFLTKNCSTLMQNSLSVLWKEFAQDPDLDETYWRPDNFFIELRKSDLTESNRLEDLKRAEEEGYYFPSTGPVYKKALKVVKESMSKPKFTNIDEYINIDPVERYENSIVDSTFYERLKSEKYIREAQLLLEELSIIRYEARMLAEMSFYFEQNDMTSIKEHMNAQLNKDELHVFKKCMLEPMVSLTRPVKRTNGIPLDIDLGKSDENSDLCYFEESKNHTKKIKIELERIDSENWGWVETIAYYLTHSRKNVEQYKSLGNI